MKLDIRAFAFACAIGWGLLVFFATWWIILFEGQTNQVTVLGHIYRGYSVSALGSVIGLGYGALDGLICGAIFAWLYNVLARPAKQPAP